MLLHGTWFYDPSCTKRDVVLVLNVNYRTNITVSCSFCPFQGPVQQPHRLSERGHLQGSDEPGPTVSGLSLKEPPFEWKCLALFLKYTCFDHPHLARCVSDLKAEHSGVLNISAAFSQHEK